MTGPIAPFGLRLPPDAKTWVEEQAKRYGSSQNHEIVRAVRERMERTSTTKTAPTGAVTPAEASPGA